MKIHPDHGFDFSKFAYEVVSLRSIVGGMWGFRNDVTIADDRRYFRARPYGRSGIEYTQFKPQEFERISSSLEEYIVPRIEKGIKKLTELMKSGENVPFTLYRERKSDDGRLAFKIEDTESNIDYYLMPPTKRDLQLTVYSVANEQINDKTPVSVVTIIARKGNDRIQCFLVDGRRIVPAVNDCGVIVGGDMIHDSGYVHYGYENMLKYFKSKGFDSIKEWWEDKYKK